ncbi:MAG: putative metal-binding motif-containing protein, partial [Candidatus Woesearchaeota archaeon]|nr:putative metal-binding motif-containing protein [Candidatus Woesearchaeota archaeon]
MTEEYVDADNDSYYSDVDCNDSDAAIHPAASDDTNDGIDNDCNGAVDEGYSAPSDDGDDDSGSDGGTAYSPPSNILQADIPQKVIPVEATPVQPAQNKAAI